MTNKSKNHKREAKNNNKGCYTKQFYKKINVSLKNDL